MQSISKPNLPHTVHHPIRKHWGETTLFPISNYNYQKTNYICCLSVLSFDHSLWKDLSLKVLDIGQANPPNISGTTKNSAKLHPTLVFISKTSKEVTDRSLEASVLFCEAHTPPSKGESHRL